MANDPFSVRLGRWLMSLFALPFVAVGVGMLVLSVLPTLYDWARMRSWQPVEATLVSAALTEQRGRKSTTFNVTADYRYSVAGREYEARRVAIGGSGDNVGDFQELLGRRLEAAWREGRPVQAWTNPSRPSEAVLDRSLRPGLLALKTVFGLLFGGFGTGLLVLLWRGRAAQSMPDAGGAEPWKARREWAQGSIASSKPLELWVLGGFAVVWNLIAVPSAMLRLPQALASGNLPAVAALGAGGLIGVGLLGWVAWTLRNARRHGDARLALDPFPGAIGGHFGATIELPVDYAPGLEFLATLSCARCYRSRTGRKGSGYETQLWQAEGVAQVEPSARGLRLSFRFDVPAHLPPSEDGATESIDWTVRVRSADPARLRFERFYEVPVYATGAQSARLHADAARHPQMQCRREAEWSAIGRLERIPGGVRLYFPYGRQWQQGLQLLFMGAVFGGAGAVAGRLGAPWPIWSFFAGLGTLIALGAGYVLANSLRVELGRQGLRAERRLLGLALWRREAGARDVVRLRLKESYSMQQAGKEQTFFRIQAMLRGGRAVTVADSLCGRAMAQQTLARLRDWTGYTAL